MVVFKYVKCKCSEHIMSKHATWHNVYFEKQPVQEGHAEPPLPPDIRGQISHVKIILCVQGGYTETGNLGQRNLCKQTLLLLHHATTFIQNSFIWAILQKMLLLCLKDIKAAYSGHFLEPSLFVES